MLRTQAALDVGGKGNFMNSNESVRMTAILSIAFLAAASARLASAATYYVDPNGNDSNSGAQSAPWKTLSNACSRVTTAGNTIYINAGNYTDNNSCSLAVGVNIQGAGASSVKITSAYGGGSNSGYINISGDAAANPIQHGNNDISGFTLDGSNKTLAVGIRVKGRDYITIHDMKLQHIKRHAISLAGWDNWPDYNTATTTPPTAWGLNDVIHDVTIDDCSSETSDTTNDRLGAITLTALADCQIYNVTINENYPNHGTAIKAVVGWLQGFKLYNSTINADHGNTDSFVLETYNFQGDSEIYNCTFNHFISLNGGRTTLVSGSSWNLKIHDNTFNLSGFANTAGNEFSHNWLNVYNNYFYGSNGPAAGLWSTNYLTSAGVSHWRFNNNVIYNCADGVWIPRGNNSYIEILNNTFDTITANPWGGSAIDAAGFTGSMYGTKIQNNLIMNAVATPITTSAGMTGSVIDHNWLNTANPGITKTGNRPSPYYQPSGSASNLVNAGANVGLPYSGTAPDIGAYEYSGATPPADTTAPTASITAPANGATVSGTVSMTATASDSVGVTKVEFYIDGALKATDTSSPYSYSLDTTQLSNASHALLAKAYDAAGNMGQSSQILVTVSNPVPDTTAPSAPLSLSMSNATQSSLTLNWSASTDNVGVAGYRLDMSLNSAFSSFVSGYQNKDIGNMTSTAITGLSASTAYYARLRAADAAGNVSGNSAAASAATAAADINAGIVGYWKFEEGSGATAEDSSGNNRSVQLLGSPTWVNGRSGKALQFNGTSGYGETNYTAALPQWTVSTWAKADAAPGNAKDAGPVMKQENFIISWDHTADAFRGAAALRVGGAWYPASFGALNGGQWYHLVATYDGETLKAYRDGTLVTSNPDPSGSADSSASSMKLGRHATDAQYFAGLVDETRVYSRAISAGEVSQLFAGMPAMDTTAPAVSITAPANGATVSGSVSLTAAASDSVGVTKVEFYVDGALKTTDTSSPYSCSLDTTQLSNASHVLLAKAYDAAGNVGQSGQVSVTVSNGSSQPTYYVATTGSDSTGDGSAGKPWASLSNACSRVTTAGNTIYINAGNYADNNSCSLAVGVNIQGAGASSVKITSAYSGGLSTGYIFISGNVAANPIQHGNNDISGFTLDGSNKTLSTGILVLGRDFVTIHDMKFQHIKVHAINLVGSDNWPDYNTATNTPPAAYGYNDIIHDVTIDDCTSQTTETTDDRLGAINLTALANCQIYNVNINENYPNHGTGIKAAVGWLKGFKLFNSTITTDHGNTDSFVLETYNFQGDSEIYNCIFNHAISLNGGRPTLDSGSSWNLKIHDNISDLSGMPNNGGHEFSHNWLNVYNNYFYGNKGPAAGLWTTNYLTSAGVSHWRFNNNVIYNCADGVWIPRGNNSYIEILNNTFDTITANPWGGSAIDAAGFTGSMYGTKIQNNLIMNAVATPITTSAGMTGSVIDHNWLNTANPGITKTGNRPSPYYQPSGSASNLVNAGANVGLPYSGTAPDIGAYEYSGATPPADTAAPSAPAGLAMSNATQSSLTLSWTASTDNVGVTGYQLDLSLNSGFTSLVAGYSNKSLGNVTSTAITGLSAGTAYYARLRAVDAAGNTSSNSTSASAATAAADINAGLVGYWRFEEGSGATAADSSGNNRSVQLLGGPAWVAGRSGKALQFNGAGSYGETNYTAALPQWTVSTWAKADAAPDNTKDAGPVMKHENFLISWDHTATEFRGAAGLSVGGVWHPASFGALSGGQWYHLAATYDGETLRAYRDGVLISSNPAPSGPADNSTSSMKLGRHAVGASFFAGLVDETRVYNRALGASEIGQLFSSIPALDTSAPTASIAAPANGATLAGAVSVTAAASDNIGVTQVEFYVDGALKAADTSSPYSYVMDTTQLTNSVHTLAAKAYDAAGNAGQSAAVSITVSNPVPDTTAPTVSAFTIPTAAAALTVAVTAFTATDNVAVAGYLLTESAAAPAAVAAGWSASAPTNHTFASAGAKTLYAWAKDAAGNVSAGKSASVVITLPDTLAPGIPAGLSMSNATASSLTLSWTASTDNVAVVGYRLDVSLNSAFSSFITGYQNKSLGNVTTTAITGLSANTAYYARLRAADAAGNVSGNSVAASARTSALPDTLAPTAAIISPANGASITGTFNIAASASDNVGVTRLEFHIDGLLKSTLTAAPYVYSLDTALLSLGSHTIMVKAYDAANNSGQQSISVTVVSSSGKTPPGKVKSRKNFLSPSSTVAATFGTDAVKVEIFNMKGMKVFEATRSGGSPITWTGKESGRLVESGAYMARITDSSGAVQYQTIVVVK